MFSFIFVAAKTIRKNKSKSKGGKKTTKAGAGGGGGGPDTDTDDKDDRSDLRRIKRPSKSIKMKASFSITMLILSIIHQIN